MKEKGSLLVSVLVPGVSVVWDRVLLRCFKMQYWVEDNKKINHGLSVLALCIGVIIGLVCVDNMYIFVGFISGMIVTLIIQLSVHMDFSVRHEIKTTKN